MCGIFTTVTSATRIITLQIQSIAAATLFGALMGNGYLAPSTVNTAINPNVTHPLSYGLISGSYFLLSGILVSVILVGMR